MDLAAFNLALKTRAAADTGAGGLFNVATPLIQGWFPNRAAQTTAFPYVVTNIAAWDAQNAFSRDVSQLIVRISVYHEKEGTDDPTTMLTCSNVLKRIYGNWSSSAPATAPTYGFHRHPLVIASGNWASTMMECTGALEAHEESYWHFIQEYRLWLSQ